MYKGNIIRKFQNLYELLHEMIVAAKCIGNIKLENKFSLSMEKVKRGIIFIPSLYHQMEELTK